MIVDRRRKWLNEKHLFAPDRLQEPDGNLPLGKPLDLTGCRQQSEIGRDGGRELRIGTSTKDCVISHRSTVHH